MENSKNSLESLRHVIESVRDYFRSAESSDLEYLLNTVVCRELKVALKDLCLQIEERYKVVESKNRDQNFIIHYTGINALFSMLQSVNGDDDQSTLRLYDSIHSNDPSEGNYLLRNLPAEYRWLGSADVRHAYIASFIMPNCKKETDNDLVFWRTYGQEGQGCSLTLSAPFSLLRRVLYGPVEVKSTIDAMVPVLDLLSSLLVNDNPSTRRRIQERLAEIFWRSMERIRYLHKSVEYSFERECRIVILSSEVAEDDIQLEYQDRTNSDARIRHFYEHDDLNMKKLLISGSSITLGPCVPFPENVKYCIEVLKNRIGLAGPIVKISDIDYRKP